MDPKSAESLLPLHTCYAPMHISLSETIKHHLRKQLAIDPETLARWKGEYLQARQLRNFSPFMEEMLADTINLEGIETCVSELQRSIPIQDRFCADCLYLFNNWPDFSNMRGPAIEGRDPWHTTIDVVLRQYHSLVLEAAARNGCWFCSYMMQRMKDADCLDICRRIEIRLVDDNNKNGSICIETSGSVSDMSDVEELWLSLPGGAYTFPRPYIHTTILSNDESMHEVKMDVLDVARSWLNSCIESHRRCKHDRPPKLPTRLLSIAGEPPKLVLTKGWEDRPQYSTLSHCWGQEPFLKMTACSYQQFMRGIPMGDLPKTFQDAIHISRSLHVEYIWIDSLCIIQDDPQDWGREASSMGAVYGGSHINIAATSSKNPHGGLFTQPKEYIDGLRTHVVVSGQSVPREFRDFDLYSHHVTGSHLATRAWTLQEKLLPPRTLHIGDRGAFWECESRTASQCLPYAYPSPEISENSRLKGLASKHTDLVSAWSSIVKIYSAANLTFTKDKLPALSGIARWFHDKCGDEYLVGLWRNSEIAYQLCWQAQDPGSRSERLPSWSWTSVDGPVDYPDYYYPDSGIFRTFVSGVDLKFATDDIFGDGTEGALRINCLGLLAGKLPGQNIASVEIDICEKWGLLVHHDFWGEQSEDKEQTVFLLPMRYFSINIRYKDQTEWVKVPKIVGIVLRSLAGQKRLERIGYFQLTSTIKNEGEKDDRFQSFLDTYKKEGHLAAAEVCEGSFEDSEYPNEEHPHPWYTLHIV